jgi:anti-sigma factor RsiW
MALAESDMQLLETYLDGELPISQAEGLWRRLAAEPELHQIMDELRDQRSHRVNIWSSHEPEDHMADAFVARLTVATRRRRWMDKANRGMYYAAGIAACALLSFRIGWIERGVNSNPVLPNDSVAQTSSFPVELRDSTGNVIGVQQFASQDEATRFVNDVNESQQRRQTHELAPNVVNASDEQF